MSRLIAIDPSLTCTGWAVFAINSDTLLAVGKIRSLPPQSPLMKRYKELQRTIEHLFKSAHFGPDDILLCEAATSMKNPDSAFKVERVRGIFEGVARQFGVQVPGRINPRSVHRYVLGLRGAQVPRLTAKLSAAQLVATLYGEALQKLGLKIDPSEKGSLHQDIVDAILVGHFALSKIRQSRDCGVTLEELFFERGEKARRGNYAGWLKAQGF